MKNRILTAAFALLIGGAAQAQSTADSIAAKYKLLPMPGAMTMEQKFPVLGNYQLQNSTEGTGTINVMLDSSNKGIVWVEGLPQGKVKAYLKKSPSTYRILAQKSATGIQVPEGTLHYDTTSHNLHIAVGKAYDESDPTGIFTSTTDMANTGNNEATNVKEETEGSKSKSKSKTPAGKSKTKLTLYTATKVMPDNMMENTEMQNSDSTQQSDSTNQQ